VIKGGYLAFGIRVPSDHKALWIDIPAAALEGTTIVTHPSVCQLEPGSLSSQKVFDNMEEQIQVHQIQQHIEALITLIAKGQLNRQQKAEYKKIDKVVINARLHAECQCHKLKMGQV